MKNFIRFFTVLILFLPAVTFFSCNDLEGSDSEGVIHLKITDAPVSGEEIGEVHVAVSRIDIHIPDQWVSLMDFGDEPVDVELLALADGITEDLGVYSVPSGKVTQVRVWLEESGCYLLKPEDDYKYPLQVSSSGGFKAVGGFDVPVNDSVHLVLDFDVRKSLGKNSSGYFLKPAIRVVGEDNSGMITGTVTDETADLDGRELTVFAYEEGTYDDSEAELSADDLYFENAVSSAHVKLCPEGYWAYRLAFLSVNYTYDLVLVEWDSGVPTVVNGQAATGLSVEPKGTTKADIIF